MLRTLTLTSSVLIATSLLWACSANDPTDDDDDGGESGEGQGATGGTGPGSGGTSGTGPGTGGSAGTAPGTGGTTPGTGGTAGTGPGTGGAAPGTGGAATGGSAGSVGAGGVAGSGAGSGGSAGAGPVVCSNADLTTLPIDETGWVARECNQRGIQGPFYCYDDRNDRAAGSTAMSNCVQDVVPYVPGMGMCISGTTVLDDTYKAWGAGIALGLNESGEAGGVGTSVKSAYNATMNNVTGFNVEITGDTGGLPLRIGFTGANPQVGAAPFIEVPGAGTYPVEIAQSLVPASWDTDPNAGQTANPASLFDMQVQVVGATAAASYNFCIKSVTPIANGDPPVTGTLMPYGSQQCGDFAQITLGNRYMVQNNLYNKGGGSQCVTAAWDNANKSGFTVNPVSLNIAPGGAPGSYPSVVYGWHVDGNMYGGYTSSRQLSAITSATSDWSFTVPAAAGRYNVSYDIWLHNTSAKPANTADTLELMIWLYQRDTTPIGTEVGTVTLGGQSWVVWYGTHDGFRTVSYIRSTNTTSVTGLDLKPFFSDAVTRGYATASAYLLGIQAGFEIWEQTQQMVTNSYSVSVN